MIIWIVVARIAAGEPGVVLPTKPEYYSSQDQCELVRSVAAYIAPEVNTECVAVRPAEKD